MEKGRIYTCRIDIKFPTNLQAEQTMQVLQVDKEPGDRVIKTFSVVEVDDDGEGNKSKVLRVELKSTEVKMLRVAVSSFYDFAQVVLKTYQEFGDGTQ